MKFKLLNIFLLAILLISVFIVSSIVSSLEQDYRSSAEELGNILKSELEIVITKQFNLLDSIEAFTMANQSDVDFEEKFYTFTEFIIEENKFIKNISVAPDGIQKYVVPLEGNELVIGHDLINDPRENVREDVNRTIETKEVAVSGPYELRQGGIGLITRKAIYNNENFWGLVVIVTDFNTLIAESKIMTVNTDFNMTLLDINQNLIYGESFNQALATQTVDLPEGYLNLLISDSERSIDKLNQKKQQWWFVLFIIMLMLGIIGYQEHKSIRDLEDKIIERTKEINLMHANLENSKLIAIHSLTQGLSHNISTPLGSSLMTSTFAQKEYNRLQKMINERLDNVDPSLVVSISEALDLTVQGLKESISVIKSLNNTNKKNISEEFIYFTLVDEINKIEKNTLLKNSEKKIRFTINCDVSIKLYNDPNVIQSILNLLLENSLDHGFKNDKSGEITINVVKSKDFIELEYSDNGQGVTESKLTEIFNPFYTTDMSETMGLGLFTVFILASQQLKAFIEAESEFGQGLKFRIRIPNS